MGEREYEVPAVILDVSGGGLSLLSPEFLDNGTLIWVKQAHHTVFGEVRNCQSTPNGFRAGIELNRT